jgi:hypothetical protein
MIENTKTRRPRKMAPDAKLAPNDDYNVAPVARDPVPREPVAPATPTKSTIVQELLARDGGASLPELCEATNWLPHTCRAFLTGLRKRGRSLEKAKRDDGATFYRLAPGGITI